MYVDQSLDIFSRKFLEKNTCNLLRFLEQTLLDPQLFKF